MIDSKDKEPHELRFEYNEITESIFLGTTVCCQTHFEEDLLAKGITTDISLQEETMDFPLGVEYYSWIPVKDNSAPTQDQFDLGVATIDSILAKDKKVYVHCKFGHGRGPSLVIAYLVYCGDSVEDAIEKVKEKRPVIHPNEIQVKALKEYENRIR
ncbi:hypothetical protein CL654_03070 [bacterium]|nr:hypothetical protein [bacterium]|tara:strand:+ start:227 stop:694 length:468 start_codon:yes stop_codon:yes gene_type:complete